MLPLSPRLRIAAVVISSPGSDRTVPLGSPFHSVPHSVRHRAYPTTQEPFRSAAWSLVPVPDMDAAADEKAVATPDSDQHREDVAAGPRLDNKGLPLVPQPTSRKDDPLVRLPARSGPLADVPELAYRPQGRHLPPGVDAGAARSFRQRRHQPGLRPAGEGLWHHAGAGVVRADGIPDVHRRRAVSGPAVRQRLRAAAPDPGRGAARRRHQHRRRLLPHVGRHHGHARLQRPRRGLDHRPGAADPLRHLLPPREGLLHGRVRPVPQQWPTHCAARRRLRGPEPRLAVLF